MCSLCHSRSHTIRDCDQVICHHCNKKGHQKRDCRSYRTVEKIQLYFPHDITVFAAVSKAPLRRIPDLAAIIRKLPDMEDTVQGTNQFWSTSNRFKIDYGNTDEIIISLQNGVDSSETKIHISPARIKVAVRYSIMNHELYEDSSHEASNSLNEADVMGPIQVVLVAKQLFESTVCLQANDSKYYLEWLQNREVVVQSAHMYNLRRGPPPRRPIASLAEYFIGPEDKRPKLNATVVEELIQENPEKNEQEAIDEGENSAQTVEYIITVEETSLTPNESQQTVDTVEPNQSGQSSTVNDEGNNTADESVLSEATARLMDQQFALSDEPSREDTDREPQDSASDCGIVEQN